MAPGRDELIEGRPFVGASGRLLWRAFYEAGLSPDQARVMNVADCFPVLGAGKKLSPEQWLACASRFENEVMSSGARVVLALGGDALLRLTGIKGEITRWRGHLISPDECTTPIKVKGGTIQPCLPPRCEVVIPSLHPAYIMRQGLKPVPFLWADVERVKRALCGDLHRVPTDDQSAWVTGARCVDIETDGIDATSAITLVGVAGPTTTGIASCSYPWPPPPQVLSELTGAELLVGHNLSFDLIHIRRELPGFAADVPVWDTMWAGQKVQPDLAKNLDTMSSLYLDCPRFKSLPTTNPERPRMDALYTLALVEPQRTALRELGQLDIFEMEMRCLPILIDMTEVGVRVDREVRTKLAAGLQLKLEEARAAWSHLAPTTNAASPTQLKKLLYDEMGLPAQYKEGKITTEKTALVKLLRHADERAREVIRTLLAVREHSKLLSTYFTSAADTVHPSYFPVQKDDANYGTATGRLSAQNPNIQNVPKHLRAMFIPHATGNVFVVGDWSQIEAWIAGTLSTDAALLSAISGDIHAVNAGLFKCDRTRAKNFYYGCQPLDSKALTRTGWKRHNELRVGDEIMGYDPVTDTLGWQRLNGIVHYTNALLGRLGHKSWSNRCTADHRWWTMRYRSWRGGSWKYHEPIYRELRSREIGHEDAIVTAAPFAGGDGVGTELHHKWQTNWVEYVLNMTPTERAAFINAVRISEGHEQPAAFVIGQNKGELADAMQLAIALHGIRTAVSNHDKAGKALNIRACKSRYITGQRVQWEPLEHGDVWCPEVITGFWLVKQDGTITITGNTTYGAGPKKIHETMLGKGFDVDYEDVASMMRAFKREYAGLMGWRKDVVAQVKTCGFAENRFGRRRYFYDAQAAAPEIWAFHPSSNAADILWRCMQQVHELAHWATGRPPTLFCHDEIVIESTPDRAQEVAARLRAIMEQPWPAIAPGFMVPAKITQGTNWRDTQ